MDLTAYFKGSAVDSEIMVGCWIINLILKSLKLHWITIWTSEKLK